MPRTSSKTSWSERGRARARGPGELRPWLFRLTQPGDRRGPAHAGATRRSTTTRSSIVTPTRGVLMRARPARARQDPPISAAPAPGAARRGRRPERRADRRPWRLPGRADARRARAPEPVKARATPTRTATDPRRARRRARRGAGERARQPTSPAGLPRLRATCRQAARARRRARPAGRPGQGAVRRPPAAVASRRPVATTRRRGARVAAVRRRDPARSAAGIRALRLGRAHRRRSRPVPRDRASACPPARPRTPAAASLTCPAGMRVADCRHPSSGRRSPRSRRGSATTGAREVRS